MSIVCIGCLFGAYALLKSNNAKQEAEEEAASNEPILELDIENPASLSFDIGDTNIEFVCEDGTWTRTDDETFPVNGDAIKTVLTDLAAVSAVRALEDAEAISEFGFEEPQNTFVYTDTNGNTTTLTIGANNASTGDDYLLVDNGEESLYTISTTLRSSISSDVYDYASAEELPDIQESDIQAVVVEKADGSYRIYKEGTTWYVEAEDGEILDADEDTVESEVGSLSYSLSYSDFVEHNCEDASVYGIDENSAVFTIQYQQGEDSAETGAEEGSTEEETEAEESSTVNTVSSTEETGAEEDTENSAEEETGVTEDSAAVSSEADAEDTNFSELTFRIGNTDELGNYYVQMDGSKEVHTIYYDTLEVFLDGLAEDWEAETEAETEVAETETEGVTE